MTNFIAKPEKTFALVVGIARYQESSWNIESEATVKDAIKFACWLRKRGVPSNNIKLCLSLIKEIQEEHQELLSYGLSVEEASSQNIENIITNFLSQKTGELLYIFWSGHGLITSERERRLLCADTTVRNWQNIDLNSLLLLLKSDFFSIHNHICIVDACANYLLEVNGRPTNLGGKIFNSGKPRTQSKQFVLLASKEGEKAKVNTENKTGYFSQAVRTALEKAPLEIFPPNMMFITEQVKRHLTSLDKKQLPTYMYHRSWDGDENTVDFKYFNPNKIAHTIPNSEAIKFLDRNQPLEKLHQLFQSNNIVTISDTTKSGGVGKTELAIQYSWKHLEDYPGGCCWIELNKLEYDIATELKEFATVHEFPNFNLPDNLTIRSQVSYCWRNWQPGNALVVFDDVTNIEQIKTYLPPMGSRFKVLITTRQSDFPYETIFLEGLPEDAALELLKKLQGEDEVMKELEIAKQILSKYARNIPLNIYVLAAMKTSTQGKILC